MKDINGLVSKRGLEFSLLLFIFFLFTSVSLFAGDEGKKNEVTGYVGLGSPTFLVPSVIYYPQYTRPTFRFGYERRWSDNWSVATSFAYAIPADWFDEFFWVESYYELYGEAGRSYEDFTEVREKRSAFIFDAGFYRYFDLSKRSEFFFFLGASYIWVRDWYRLVDEGSSLEESILISQKININQPILGLGLGLKYALDDRFSFRCEWRADGHPYLWYDCLLVGLSYRF
jgi:hypothetical protein